MTPILLAIVLSQQDLTKTVDYTTRARPIADVLIDLTKQTGINLVCTKELEQEPIILKFNHVTVKDAMDKIAYVTAGEWKQRDKEWELQRGKLADQLHAQALKDNAADFRSGVQQAVARLGADKPYTKEQAQQQYQMVLAYLANPSPETSLSGFWERTPATRLLLRILQKLDPASVADMPNTHKLVFSNEPTTLQLQLPDVRQDFDRFEEEQAVLDALFDQGNQQHGGRDDWLPSGLRHKSNGKVGRIWITLQGVNGRYDSGITIADTEGNIFALGSSDINWRDAQRANWLTEVALTRGAKITTNLGPIASQVLNNIDNQFNFKYLPDTVKSVLLAPSQTDPLSIATSDVVLGLTDKNSENAAFLAPDDADSWCYELAKNGKISLAAFEQAASFSNKLEVTEDNGWLIGAPLDPYALVDERLSRTALESLLKSVEERRTVGIDERARFECDASPDANKILADDSFWALHNWPYRNEETGSEPCLALFGALSDEERVAAKKQPIRIRVSDLSDQQLSYLKEWVMMAGAHFSVPGREKASGGDEQTLADYGEPTEVLAKSTANAYLEVSDSTKPDYSVKWSADAKKFRSGGDIGSLGWLSARLERPDLFPEYKDKQLNWISVGTSRTVTIRCVVDNVDQIQEFSESKHAHPWDPTITLQELLHSISPEMLKEYNDNLQKARVEFAKGHP